jgi:hypothetical protein
MAATRLYQHSPHSAAVAVVAMDSQAVREAPAAVAEAAAAQRVVAQQAAKDLLEATLSQETPQGKRPEVEAVALELRGSPEIHRKTVATAASVKLQPLPDKAFTTRAVVAVQESRAMVTRKVSVVLVVEEMLRGQAPGVREPMVSVAAVVVSVITARAEMAAQASLWSATRVHLPEPEEPLLRVPARLRATRFTPSRTRGQARSIFPD